MTFSHAGKLFIFKPLAWPEKQIRIHSLPLFSLRPEMSQQKRSSVHRYLFCACSEVTVFWVNIRRLSQGRSALVYLMDLSSCFTATSTQAGSDPHNKKSRTELPRGIECWWAGFSWQLPSRWHHIMQHVLAASFGNVLGFFFPPGLLRWQCVWWVCVLRLLQCYRFCRCQCWFWQLDADVGGMVGFAASVTEEKILIYWTRCQFNLQGVLL